MGAMSDRLRQHNLANPYAITMPPADAELANHTKNSILHATQEGSKHTEGTARSHTPPFFPLTFW